MRFLLLLFSLVSPVAGVNPLSRIFMMMTRRTDPSEDDGGSMKSIEGNDVNKKPNTAVVIANIHRGGEDNTIHNEYTSNYDDNDGTTMVRLSELQVQVNECRRTLMNITKAQNVSSILTEQLENINTERKICETRLERTLHDLSQTQEESRRLTSNKQDLVQQMAQIQSQASKEVMEAKETIKQAQKTIDKLESNNENLKHQQQLSNQRVEESEKLWKKEVDAVQTKALLQIQAAQYAAEQVCQETIKSKLEQIKDENIDVNVNNSKSNHTEGTSTKISNSPLSNVERVKFRMLEEETASLKEHVRVMEMLANQLDEQYKEKIAEKEVALENQMTPQIESLAQEKCQVHIETLQEKADQHVDKAMELCQEEAGHELQKLEFQHEARLQSMQEAYAQNITLLQNKINKLQRSLEDSNKAQLLQTQQLNKTIIDLQTEQESIIAKHSLEIKEIEGTTIARLTKQHEIYLLDLEKKYLEKQEQTQKAQELALQDHMDTLGLLNQTKSNITVLQSQLMDLVQQLKTSNDQGEYWKSVFEQRSLFNATLLKQKTMIRLDQMRNRTQHECSRAFESLQRQPLFQFIITTLQRCYRSLDIFYQTYLQKYLQPIFDEITRVLLQMKKNFVGLLQGVLKDIERTCALWKNPDRHNPEFVKTTVNDFCEDPLQFMSRTLLIVVFVLAVVFRRRFYELLIKGVILFSKSLRKTIWFVFWWMNPIRWGFAILHILFLRMQEQPKKTIDTNGIVTHQQLNVEGCEFANDSNLVDSNSQQQQKTVETNGIVTNKQLNVDRCAVANDSNLQQPEETAETDGIVTHTQLNVEGCEFANDSNLVDSNLQQPEETAETHGIVIHQQLNGDGCEVTNDSNLVNSNLQQPEETAETHGIVTQKLLDVEERVDAKDSNLVDSNLQQPEETAETNGIVTHAQLNVEGCEVSNDSNLKQPEETTGPTGIVIHEQVNVDGCDVSNHSN